MRTEVDGPVLPAAPRGGRERPQSGRPGPLARTGPAAGKAAVRRLSCGPSSNAELLRTRRLLERLPGRHRLPEVRHACGGPAEVLRAHAPLAPAAAAGVDAVVDDPVLR